MTVTGQTRRRTTHRTVADVMSQDLAVIAPDATYKDAVLLLQARRVSALPVVDADGALVGVVSEGDLLAKERHMEEPFLGGLRPSWRTEHARAEAVLVRELMSSPAITVAWDASLPVAARTMHREGVRRLCVLDRHGALVGIVTRGDLLRPFVRADAELAEDIRSGVIVETMWLDPERLEVSVEDGMARISGTVERRSEAEILEALVRNVDGIVAVELRVSWAVDDREFRVSQLPPPV